jgi:translocation and assembly module TamB
MAPGRRIARYVAAGIGVVILLLLGAVLILTQTDRGREKVRGIVLDRLDSITDGEITVGRVGGNLLRRVDLIGVIIVDERGRPFLRADTVATRFSLLALLRQRIVLTDLLLARPQIVLDKPPGEDWNYVRIFRIEPDTLPAERRPGWGDWIALNDVRIVDGRLTVRTAWKPPDDLAGPDRERALREALSRETRENVVPVPGGYQNVMDFRELNAELSRVVPAHPDSAGIPIEVARFSGIIEPFHPPAAVVEDLSGKFRLEDDSLHFSAVQAVLPGTRMTAQGVYALHSGELSLQSRGAPMSFVDMRWIYPLLPEEGGGDVVLDIELGSTTTHIVADQMDLRLGDASIAGRLDLVTGDTLRLGASDLRFARVPVTLIQEYVPSFAPPRPGRLSGRLALRGPPDALRVDGDVTFDDAAGPSSRVVADGELGLDGPTGFRQLRLEFQPLQASLVRAVVREAPVRGTIAGTVTLTGRIGGVLQLDGDMAMRDPATGTSRVRARGGIDMTGPVQLRALRVAFDPLQAELIREYVTDLPLGGTLAGELRLDGPPSGTLRVTGAVAHRHPSTGTSHIGLNGGVRLGDELRFSDLDLRFEPLRARLVQAFVPALPLGGTIEGTATLDGAPGTRIIVQADVRHDDAGHRSHVTGRADISAGSGGSANVDAMLQPLSLAAAGRFAPGAQLHGAVAGPVRAAGRLDDLRVTAELDVVGGGALRVDGVLDLASAQTGYALDLRLRAFDVAAVTRRAPAATALSGAASARGRGRHPATMHATFEADLVDSEVDDVTTDVVRVRAAIEHGLAAIDSSVVRIGAAEAILDGSFGLAAGRRGELHYHVTVDSLHAFAAWLPADEGVPMANDAADPANASDVDDEVRVAGAVLGADSVLIGAAADVEPVPTDSLAGRLKAAGTLRGAIQQFAVEGTAELEDLVFRGTQVGQGRVEYSLADAATPALDIALDGSFDDVVAAGLAFESLTATGEYRGGRYGEGSFEVAARQDDATELRADATFVLSLERNELRIADAAVRFDTVTWRTAQPGTVNWGDAGIEVRGIELTSNHDGRIYADGQLPGEGSGDLELSVEGLEIAQLTALLQTDVDLTGRLDLDANVTGTVRSPIMRGTATLTASRVDGDTAPDAHITFGYTGRTLSADAELRQDDRVLVVATAQLPIDLGLDGDVTRRLLPGNVVIDVRSDSLPIEAFPVLTEHIEDLTGRVTGDITVRGTWEDAILNGMLDLELESVRVVPVGVRFRDITGRLSLDGSTISVDSIAARSGGPVRVTGELDVSTLTAPVFDLAVETRNALVIDTEDVRLRADANIAVTGPITALEVTGDVHARSGMWRIPELADIGTRNIVNLDEPEMLASLDTAFVAERAVMRRRSPLLENMQVDIAVTIDRDVWLRSTEANVEIYTPSETGPLHVRLNGTGDGFALEGTINTDRGEYEFMSRRFNLTRGALTFTGETEINPLLQVVAEHEVRLPGREAFQIRVVLGGTVQDLTIALESSAQPPIAQTDLLSYLAFGRDASTLLYQQGSALSGESGSAGALVGNVAGLATQQLAAVAMEAAVSELEMGAMRDLGLDVFRITPADLPAELFTGRYSDVLRGTEVEAGRYISPRLFVAGQVRAGLSRPGIRMEYRTPRGFQWHASWQGRFLPTEPTLTDTEPRRGGVLGAFLFREWRF